MGGGNVACHRQGPVAPLAPPAKNSISGHRRPPAPRGGNPCRTGPFYGQVPDEVLRMPMSPPVLLLRVAAAWPLPGLGLLVLPDGPTPYLAACSLHVALAIEAHLPDGTRHSGLATVEEVSRPTDATGPASGLLLDLGPIQQLPVGSTIWLVGPGPELI